jgi:hypothetical protein
MQNKKAGNVWSNASQTECSVHPACMVVPSCGLLSDWWLHATCASKQNPLGLAVLVAVQTRLSLQINFLTQHLTYVLQVLIQLVQGLCAG